MPGSKISEPFIITEDFMKKEMEEHNNSLSEKRKAKYPKHIEDSIIKLKNYGFSWGKVSEILEKKFNFKKSKNAIISYYTQYLEEK